MKVFIKKDDAEVKSPAYAHEGDAGIDLYAAETVEIKPKERKLVSTGIRIQLEHGYEAQVRPKSGLAINHGITVLNTPGTIDAGYRGLVKVILFNASNEAFTIEKNTKIAQMVFNKIEVPELEYVDSLEESKRGEGGFGSTGLA